MMMPREAEEFAEQYFAAGFKAAAQQLGLAWAEYNRAERDAAAAEARPTFEHMEALARWEGERAALRQRIKELEAEIASWTPRLDGHDPPA